jgi:hypothetical protein
MSHRGEYLRCHGSSSCAYIRFVYLIPMKYQYINLTYKLQPFVVAWLGQHQQWHHKALSSMRWHHMSNSSSLRDEILLPTVGSSFCESHADQYLPLLSFLCDFSCKQSTSYWIQVLCLFSVIQPMIGS